MDAPEEFSRIFEQLRSEGIICHFGKWLEVKGKPFTILIDFHGLIPKKNDIKTQYWMDYGIDSIRSAWDFDEPLLWSYSVGRMIGLLEQQSFNGKKIVAQFHEWLSGPGLLYLKKNNPSVATVFTTHATVLGRTLCSRGIDIYDSLDSIDVLREVYTYLIEPKFLMEKASALNADAFTTVSEITSIESEKFLGRKADVLVLNGLDLDKFPSFEEISVKHIASREKIKEFLTYYFFPYYTFDVHDSLIFFTVGRYEYKNKGYDTLIKALGRFNAYLKFRYAKPEANNQNPVAVSVFIWVPMAHHGLRIDVLENKNYYMHIKSYIHSNTSDILNKIVYDFISKKESVGNLFTENFMADIKKDLVAFERTGNPPMSTHNMDEYSNNVMFALKQNGLLNRKEDFVKVIVEPVYLDGNDGFIDLSYYDAMVGCHLGLFPSYYEPWGYTPLESASLGVPSLTTDLAGFGRFIKTKNPDNKGIYVIDRFHHSEEDVLKQFVDVLIKFYDMDRSERVNQKLDAKSLSANADWKDLIQNYIHAHNFALENNRKK
jgi:glycogen(starch) synthase